MATAAVIGSGPNGLAAAITVASAGVKTIVFERSKKIGGACSTGETTLPGFQHDLGSSVYAMAQPSPFFRSLPLEFPWIQPDAPCAHPLDDGTAVMLERSIEETVAGLDRVDGHAYRALLGTISARFTELVDDLLSPLLHVPYHPWLMAGFGPWALLPATTLAGLRFHGPRAKALFAGMAAHSVLSLEAPSSAAVGMVLMAAGHAGGWPIVQGGAQTIANGLAEHLRSLGGTIETGVEVMGLDRKTDVTLADVTPRQLLRMAGGVLPDDYLRQLASYRYGAGAFKVDYALSQPIPWKAVECARAATVHLGGSFEEIVASERTFSSDKPFVLLVQPSLFDPTRAPEGKHTAWAYCHVPNGSSIDRLADIEGQIERFAPGFKECVLARSVMTPRALERWNPNLVGGDFSGGAMNLKQLAFRPTPSLYRTPVQGVYLCGASTPPGGGVHGMGGYHAGRAALRDLGIHA